MPDQRTYCNPLSLPAAVFRRSFADPDVVFWKGSYYLFVSGAQLWVSTDLVNWQYRDVGLPEGIIAPAVAEYKGSFYLAGNGASGMWKAETPLGPWKRIGELTDTAGNRIFWADMMFFVDDDDGFYCYHNSGAGIGTDGVFVTRLDPAYDFTRPLGPTINCFAYNPDHLWERWGDRNEHPDVAWIEGPYLTKHQGKYYLQYSGAGTEWKSYAVGVYASDSPLGPFTYQSSSPVLKERGGLLNGTGHHAVVKGPDGNYWCLYHVLFHNRSKWDRRICLDPLVFDEKDGLQILGPTETPQRVPGKGNDLRQKDAGLKLLSQNKEVSSDSFSPGRGPEYAVDNYVRTWWQAADEGFPHWLEIDLAAEFKVAAVRVIFAEAAGSRSRDQGNWSFRMETSIDGKDWNEIVPKTESSSDIYYEQIPEAVCKKIKITILAAPPSKPAGIVELSVFGR